MSEYGGRPDSWQAPGGRGLVRRVQVPVNTPPTGQRFDKRPIAPVAPVAPSTYDVDSVNVPATPKERGLAERIGRRITVKTAKVVGAYAACMAVATVGVTVVAEYPTTKHLFSIQDESVYTRDVGHSINAVWHNMTLPALALRDVDVVFNKVFGGEE